MSEVQPQHLNDALIRQLGLKPASNTINAQIAPSARVFEYPAVANVYLMENDLYGNAMPQGSLFLAFDGHSGMAGKHISIDTLMNSSAEDIRKMVADNDSG